MCSPTSAASAFCDFAFQLASEAFDPHDPRRPKIDLPVERFAEILADLKPHFIHHPVEGPASGPAGRVRLRPRADVLRRAAFADVDARRLPHVGDRLCVSPAPRHVVLGAPEPDQLVAPDRDVQPGNVMAFHLRYWTSRSATARTTYNYDEWTKTSRQRVPDSGRTRAASRTQRSRRARSAAARHLPPGGVLVFSAAHMHSSVPNTTGRTRLSIDFRTVNLDDLEAVSGAPNVHSECPRTNLGDFLRVSDLAPVPSEVIEAEKARRGSAGGGRLEAPALSAGAGRRPAPARPRGRGSARRRGGPSRGGSPAPRSRRPRRRRGARPGRWSRRRSGSRGGRWR